MWPTLGTIGGHSVYAYGVMISLALGLWLALAVLLRERAGLTTGDVLNCALLGIAAYLFAPKLWAMAKTGSFGVTAWLDLARPWQQGATGTGPVVSAAALAWLGYCLIRRIPFLLLMDTQLPVVLLVMAVQRIGCFLAGCCYGVPTVLPWGVCFPPGSPAELAYPGSAVHPTQLYYVLTFGSLAGLLLLARPRPARAGAVTAAGWLGAGLAYAFVTTLRGDHGAAPLSPWATTTQLVALAFAAAGLALALAVWRRARFLESEFLSGPADAAQPVARSNRRIP